MKSRVKPMPVACSVSTFSIRIKIGTSCEGVSRVAGRVATRSLAEGNHIALPPLFQFTAHRSAEQEDAFVLHLASDAVPHRLNRLGGGGGGGQKCRAGLMKTPILPGEKMLLRSPWIRKDKRKSGCPKEFILRI